MMQVHFDSSKFTSSTEEKYNRHIGLVKVHPSLKNHDGLNLIHLKYDAIISYDIRSTS